MISDANRHLIEALLICDESYGKIAEIYSEEEVGVFIKGLFDKIDEFNTSNLQFDREKQIRHLEDVKFYITEQLGTNTKLLEDIEKEIKNQSSDKIREHDYYDDLLKLKAAIDLHV